MQYPVELPGVRTWQFLKAAVDALRKHKGESELSVRQFDRLLDSKRELVNIDDDRVRRSVNGATRAARRSETRSFSSRCWTPGSRCWTRRTRGWT